MQRAPFVFIIAVTLLILSQQSVSIDPYVLKNIRDCLGGNHTFLCLKEKALDILNQTINSDQTLNLYDVLDITKDPNYTLNFTDNNEVLSNDVHQRSLQLNNMLTDKIDEFISSRVIKLNLGHIMEDLARHYFVEEYKPQPEDDVSNKIYKNIIISSFADDGRGKKGKKGGMLMMGGLAMAGMMAQLFMGKIAFMAGAALLVAKLALLLSSIIGFKKLSGGSSGGESHVVYAADAGGGYGHSHGGWHRSHDDVVEFPYSAYATTQDSQMH